MDIAVITGSGGLIGSEATRFFSGKGFATIGIDNDMRKYFFGEEASTAWNVNNLKAELEDYTHFAYDIRDEKAMRSIFAEYGSDIRTVIHTAAQPSHDWATQEPLTDFTINANGTQIVLEMTRQYCPRAVFIFTSTNKVYGDQPNLLPLVELDTRWEIDPAHPYAQFGIDERMSIDQSKHSIFGASKLAADILVQEYGRYFGMSTVCFRGGCLTGARHSGAELHGFLAYLARAIREGRTYNIYGYKGKQVRDNIHSEDVCSAFWEFYKHPQSGAVYNLGGGRANSVSLIEAVARLETLLGKKLDTQYVDSPRSGDHICYISDLRRLMTDYPAWRIRWSLDDILADLAMRVHCQGEGAGAPGLILRRESVPGA